MEESDAKEWRKYSVVKNFKPGHIYITTWGDIKFFLYEDNYITKALILNGKFAGQERIFNDRVVDKADYRIIK